VTDYVLLWGPDEGASCRKNVFKNQWSTPGCRLLLFWTPFSLSLPSAVNYCLVWSTWDLPHLPYAASCCRGPRYLSHRRLQSTTGPFVPHGADFTCHMQAVAVEDPILFPTAVCSQLLPRLVHMGLTPLAKCRLLLSRILSSLSLPSAVISCSCKFARWACCYRNLQTASATPLSGTSNDHSCITGCPRSRARDRPQEAKEPVSTQNYWASELCPSSANWICSRPQMKGEKHVLCWAL
jgi:hypothetical protein